ncbi:C39 family peptidase [Streptococcus merionis]|uniref:Putative lipoprotein n=1 Tax=Streptococcus merionis TaxID=400065 RepID=A0A239SL52_9STRE|nr:C39 family peptidase [Streptococcus merionis]SNU86160.1 putative lipoprotein [Streptococcus merionis]
MVDFKAIKFLTAALLCVTLLVGCQSKSRDVGKAANTTKTSSQQKTSGKEASQESSSSETDSLTDEAKRSKEKTIATTERSGAAVSTDNTPPLSQDTIDKINGQGQNSGQGGTKHQLQVTQQVQRDWNTCAPTTVSMMLSARGVTASQEELAQAMGTDDSFGTHNTDAIRVLNRYLFGYEQPTGNQSGYRLATVTTADLNSEEMRVFKERLKQNIADGYPMYYTFDNARIYPGSSGEHNVIGTGYQLTEDGSDIAYLYYIDPSYTQQDPTYGGLKKITPQELFHAMLTCVEPNYGW